MYWSIGIIAVLFFAAWLGDWEVWIIEESREEVEREARNDPWLQAAFIVLLASVYVFYVDGMVHMMKEILRLRGYFVSRHTLMVD